VPVPACTDRLDPTITHPAQSEAQFYDAMGEGGPACAVATVEQMTNIRIDHFVELTFDAFIQLTDAVGGVQVCVPEPGINDPDYSGLVLSAGLHTVSGNEALAFVRDRHGLATGEDTQRIRMQQMFMTSLFNKLTSNGTIEDPITLYKIADSVSGDLTVDTGLDNLSTMISMAESVGTIDKKYMQYVTAPYALDSPGQYDYDPDGEHSSPGPGFDQLWSYLRADQPIPGSPAAAAFAAAPAPAAGAAAAPGSGSGSGSGANSGPTVPAKDVSVVVYNGTDNPGEATSAAANLAALGMTATVGDSGYYGYDATTIYYPANEQAQADTLANQIAGSVALQSSNVTGLTLVIGTNAPSAILAAPSDADAAAAAGPAAASTTAAADAGSAGTTAPAATPSGTGGTESRTGNENLCSDLPGVVDYGGSPGD
jgi:LCP family protein required for cell wall assembly